MLDQELIRGVEAISDSSNEAEVEDKVVLPLLKRFGITANDFIPQGEIPRLDIAKGVEVKRAFLPDYLLTFFGLYVAVIEAKSPSESVQNAYREACFYSTELHRQLGTLTDVKVAVGCNGREIWVGTPETSDKDAKKYDVRKLVSSPTLLAELEAWIGRKTLNDHANERRLARRLGEASNVRTDLFLGAAIPKNEHNSFYPAIRPLLNTYFGNLSLLRDELFLKGYCDPSEQQRTREEEDVLRDRPPARSDAKLLTRHNADELVGDIVRHFHSYHTGEDTSFEPDRFFLLLGAAGAGKSTFTWWYTKFSVDHKKCVPILIDGTKAPQDSEPLFAHTLQKLTSTVHEFLVANVYGGDRQRAIRSILRESWEKDYYEFFHPKIEKPDYLDQHFPKLAKPIKESDEVFLPFLLEDLHRNGLVAMLIVDNLDLTNVARQLDGFKLFRPFSQQFEVLIGLVLRDETWQFYAKRKPFEGFHSSPTFYIAGPSLSELIDKRVEVMTEGLGQTGKRNVVIPFGANKNMKLELSMKDTAELIAKVHEGLSKPDDLHLIEGVCGKNNRNGLDAFAVVCTSSYVEEINLLQPTFKVGAFDPSRAQLLKALICGDSKYYDSHSSFVANAYTFGQGTDGSSIFVVLHILRELLFKAGGTPGFGKGYVPLTDLQELLMKWLPLDVSELRRITFGIVRTGIWQVDTFEPTSESDFNAVRIQEQGLYLLKTLYKDDTYLECMAFDTAIADRFTLGELVEAFKSDRRCSDLFLTYLKGKEVIEVEHASARGFKLDPSRKKFM
ncbi:MAG: hypothetical protein IT462_02230 [Planctomycetes bacterium]|nr:hypothetical protein [Planctomycetota bacterium]